MPTASFLVVTALFGGAAFWLSSIAWHAIRAGRDSILDVVVLTVMLPIMAVIAARLTIAWRGGAGGASAAPSAILAGIWMMGPLAMFVGAAATGGGFVRETWWRELAMLTVMFPFTTFSFSTYDGSLYGVLLATVALLLIRTGGATRYFDIGHGR